MSSSSPSLSTGIVVAAGIAAAGLLAVRALRRSGERPPSSSSSSVVSPLTPAPSSPLISPRGRGTGTDAAAAGTPLEDPWRLTEPGGFTFSSETTLVDALHIDAVLRLEVPTLRRLCGAGASADAPNLREPLPIYDGGAAGANSSDESSSRTPYISYVDESYLILGDIVRKAGQKPVSRAYVRAGPRRTLFFQPHAVRAAIVTCGGLCPGMNNVIRELVLTLHNSYGVASVLGVQHGYWGFHTPDADPEAHARGNPLAPTDEPLLLTPELVADIHHTGGTRIGSDRGGHDVDVILRFCANRGVSQLYIIGGDGTHRGAHAVALRAAERGLVLAVAAIPKTIDNDVDIIDRSFGFDTSVAEAQRAIATAKTEASGAVNGLGLVKLMGRYAGFIAAHASLASGDVDLCLIPEVPLTFDGPASILEHVAATIRAKGHAVVVVAEGAGEEELDGKRERERMGGVGMGGGGNGRGGKGEAGRSPLATTTTPPHTPPPDSPHTHTHTPLPLCHCRSRDHRGRRRRGDGRGRQPQAPCHRPVAAEEDAHLPREDGADQGQLQIHRPELHHPKVRECERRAEVSSVAPLLSSHVSPSPRLPSSSSSSPLAASPRTRPTPSTAPCSPRTRCTAPWLASRPSPRAS
jgi:6-phosphofructokinase